MKRLLILTTLLLTLLSGLSLAEPHMARAQGTGPFAYIANSSDGTVSVIDTSTNNVITTIPVGKYSGAVAVNSTGTRVYVISADGIDFEQWKVSMIDTSTNRVVATVAVGQSPRGIAINPAGTRVYVADELCNCVNVIDTSINSVVTSVSTGSSIPQDLVVNPAGTRVYVNTGAVIDTSTNRVVANVVGGVNGKVTVTSDGTRVYMAGYENLYIIDTSTNNVVGTVNISKHHGDVAVNLSGTRVYITNSIDNNVSIINTSNNSVIATVSVGNSPLGVAVNPANTRVYVTNRQSNNVSVIDTSTNTVVDTLAVGNGPGGIAIGPVLATPISTNTPIPPTSTNTPIPPPFTPIPPTKTNTPIPPTPTNTPTPTPQVAPPDAYEIDNSCPEAKPINTDGVSQNHTFHAPNDQDWLSFQVTAGITYVIRADIAASSKTDLIGELYGDCGTIIEPGQNPSFSGGVFYHLIPTTSGTYHLHLLNDKPDVFGADIAYQVSVRPQLTRQDAGVLVLVTGRKESNDIFDLQDKLQNISKQVYQLWRSKGHPPERIYALATDLNLDLNGDKQPDVQALANKANLQYAITEWTKDKGLGPDRAFTLYLVDHGGSGGRFYLDKPRGEEVNSTELASWLTTLETQAPEVKVNVIIEACYSGGFIFKAPRPRLLQPLQTLSGPNRVIIASADAVSLAYASETGGRFSDSFISGLQQDLNLSDAFSRAKDAAKSYDSSQIAMLDGNGNGTPNEIADSAAAARRGFGISGSFADTELWPPYIKEVTITAQNNGLAEIKAEIIDKETSDTGLKVWAVIYPPSYQPPADSELLVQSPVPVPLFSRGNHQFAVSYPAFTEQGTYRVVIQAQDQDNLLGQPYQVEFGRAKSLLYLPLILK